MVGEIRDSETSGLAVQAALTGHLVFATLHTNNAATCLPRLLDMGIEPFLIASTVRAVVGQRLVRRLCRNCRIPVAPETDLVKKINKTFKIKASDDMKKINQLEKLAIEGGIGIDPENKNNEVNQPSSSGTAINRIYKAKDGGCEECGHNGYKGRMGIYEVLGNSSELEKLIISNSTSDAIENQAIKEGMITMQLDGFIKALRGQTTIEEILRVTATEE
jgi:type IV pilus assembly protein PilB